MMEREEEENCGRKGNIGIDDNRFEKWEEKNTGKRKENGRNGLGTKREVKKRNE